MAEGPSVDGRVWDVVVVGSGPAGSCAALSVLTADPAKSVLLLDRSGFPRDKCCGDAVLTRVTAELAAYDVAVPNLFTGYSPVRDMRFVTSSGNEASGLLPEAMSVIPRRVFDDRLRTAARDAGAEWARRTVRRVDDHGHVVDIDGAIRAKVVIGADGAESVVRRAVDSTPRRDVAVALRGYDAHDGDPTPTMAFHRRRGLSYAWRFPSTAGPANVGYGHVLAPGERSSRAELLRTMQRLLPEARPDPATLSAHRLPLSSCAQRRGRGRVMLAGDAAALINPLSGEGIYYAMTSGLLAGSAAVYGDSRVGMRYEGRLRRRFGAHHRHAATLAAAVTIPGVLDAGLVGVGRDARAFQDLAELGLGHGRVTARLAGVVARQVLLDRLRGHS